MVAPAGASLAGRPCTRVRAHSARPLERALRNRVAFEAHGQARRVHHHEHVFEPAIGLADQIAERAFVSPNASTHVGLAWMPSLCSMDTQRTSLRSPSEPSSFDQNFRHDEQRDALRAGGAPSMRASTM